MRYYVNSEGMLVTEQPGSTSVPLRYPEVCGYAEHEPSIVRISWGAVQCIPCNRIAYLEATPSEESLFPRPKMKEKYRTYGPQPMIQFAAEPTPASSFWSQSFTAGTTGAN